MNTVCLLGRITRDLELKYSQNNMAVCKFSVAIDRRTKEKETDFINCVAFGKTAEFLNSYFGKGRAIAITGHIQTGSYTNKDGNKVYTTEVICDSLDFADSKRSNDNINDSEPAPYQLSESEEDLPF